MPADLAAAREILSRMTPGEWYVDNAGRVVLTENGRRVISDLELADGGSNRPSDDRIGIAYLHNHYGKALDEIEALRAEYAAMEKGKQG